jgi:hypothetical protein
MGRNWVGCKHWQGPDEPLYTRARARLRARIFEVAWRRGRFSIAKSAALTAACKTNTSDVMSILRTVVRFIVPKGLCDGSLA